jgi:hypothetical protein
MGNESLFALDTSVEYITVFGGKLMEGIEEYDLLSIAEEPFNGPFNKFEAAGIG